jgi:bifunctional DNA-binding transcriptional regulator/antitoxin component of YhaV-PrlF toxin-antitoxin module
MRTVIKVEKAGRGQIPIDVRRKMDVKEGDILVEIKEILKTEVPA